MVRSATDTRRRVLATARNLFSSHGYNGTSLSDLLDAVGITKGAFYYYFKGKDTLCQVVLEQAVEEFHPLAKAAAETAGPDSLSRWLTLIVQQAAEGQWLNFRLLTRLTIECADLPPVCQEQLVSFWQWYQGFFETLLRQSLGPGRANDPDVPVLARSLLCSLFGALWLDRCVASTTDLAHVADLQLRQLLK